MKFPKRVIVKLSQHKYRKLCEYIFNRDGCCVFCGNTSSATPAHIIRRSTQRLDTPNNIVRACVWCHAAFDQYKIKLPERVRRMLASEPATLEEVEERKCLVLM